MKKKDVNVTFRETTLADLDYYRTWLQQDGVLEWCPMSNPSEVDIAVGHAKYFMHKGGATTAIHSDKAVGLCMLFINDIKKLSHHSLFLIIVDEAYRGQGVGTLLLQHVINSAKKDHGLEILHLEVYENNPAINLYKKVGFKQYGKHEKFIKDDKGQYFCKVMMEMEL